MNLNSPKIEQNALKGAVVIILILLFLFFLYKKIF